MAPLLFLFSMVAVDGGTLAYRHAQLQATADAAALYGVDGLLDLSWHSKAEQIIRDNERGSYSPQATDDGLQLGLWDPDSRQFLGTSAGNRHELPAVKVTLEEQVPMAFAGMFGFDTPTLHATAIATPRPGKDKEHYYYALLAKDRIFADGTADFDSYSSKDRPTFPGSDDSGDQEFVGGTTGDVELASGVEIWGDFNSGEDTAGSISTSMFKAGGKQGKIDYDIEFDDPVIPSDALSLGSVSVGSGTYVLPGGKYVLDSVNIGSNVNVKFLGPVEIYLRGDCQINAKVETYNMQPENLKIVQTASADVNINAPHDISDEYTLVADVYNPKGTVHLDGKVNFYGRIWAKEAGFTAGSDFFGDTNLTQQVTDDFSSASLVD